MSPVQVPGQCSSPWIGWFWRCCPWIRWVSCHIVQRQRGWAARPGFDRGTRGEYWRHRWDPKCSRCGWRWSALAVPVSVHGVSGVLGVGGLCHRVGVQHSGHCWRRSSQNRILALLWVHLLFQCAHVFECLPSVLGIADLQCLHAISGDHWWDKSWLAWGCYLSLDCLDLTPEGSDGFEALSAAGLRGFEDGREGACRVWILAEQFVAKGSASQHAIEHLGVSLHLPQYVHALCGYRGLHRLLQ